MNQRDRLFIQREWIAWADWQRRAQVFSISVNVGLLNRLYCSMPEIQQKTITGIYISRLSERFVSDGLGISRHNVRALLSDSYIAGLYTLKTKQLPAKIVSA
jgi:hypothetical protein